MTNEEAANIILNNINPGEEVEEMFRRYGKVEGRKLTEEAFLKAVHSLRAWDEIISIITNEVEENGRKEWGEVLDIINLYLDKE